MPHAVSELDAFQYLRLLVMGAPKDGKSCSVICTSPYPVYVINCDQKRAIKSVRARGRELGLPDDFFVWDYVRGFQDMEKAIREAQRGVKAKEYKTIVVDTISGYARRLLSEMLILTRTGSGEEDGRKAYPETTKRAHNVFDRLDHLKAHVIFTSHYRSQGGAIDGQLAKEGPGIAPLLPGDLRQSLPGEFQDVVFLERVVERDKVTKKRKERCVFVTHKAGVWGPGCRSLAKRDPAYRVVPADISKLIEIFESQDPKPKKLSEAAE
jgi:hypothetical protein